MSVFEEKSYFQCWKPTVTEILLYHVSYISRKKNWKLLSIDTVPSFSSNVWSILD